VRCPGSVTRQPIGGPPQIVPAQSHDNGSLPQGSGAQEYVTPAPPWCSTQISPSAQSAPLHTGPDVLHGVDVTLHTPVVVLQLAATIPVVVH
jgi:hypothetical protein